MKSKIKKTLAATLAFATLAGGTAALAENEVFFNRPTALCVGGTFLTQAGDSVEGNLGGTATLSGTAEAPVLTLSNFRYNGLGDITPEGNVQFSGIYYGTELPPLTIVLVGENRIELQDQFYGALGSVGIDVRSDTTIRAEEGGSLYVSGGNAGSEYDSAGIAFRGANLTLDSGIITAVGKNAQNYGGIYGYGGDLTINTAVTAICENGNAINILSYELNIYNSVPGKAWSDVAGTKDETDIGINPAWLSMSNIRRVEFGAAASDVRGTVTDVAANNDGTNSDGTNDNGATALITTFTKRGSSDFTVRKVTWNVTAQDTTKQFAVSNELPALTFMDDTTEVIIALAIDNIYDPDATAIVTVE